LVSRHNGIKTRLRVSENRVMGRISESKGQQITAEWRKLHNVDIRNLWSRDSSVGIVTGYGLDDRGVRVRAPIGSRMFCSPCRPDRHWRPPNFLSNGYRGLFPRGVKWPGREADPSPPASAEVKKMWRMSSSGMWRCVDLASTDVSEERIASIFRVEKSASGEPA
jgi:hypothetical protein